MTETVTQAVARKDSSPAALIKQYESSFAAVVPSHVKAETFIRLAQGALRRNPTLEEAARANPGSLLAALLDAARQGLEPGTEQYYLVPYKDKGRYVVQGIPGYQGEIELMYRAGAVASVVVEVVRETDPVFIWSPGKLDHNRPPRWEGPMVRPYHEVDWFGERGPLKGVYAYAELTSGAVSKVVVLSREHIFAARAKSASFKFKPETSPWTTDEEAMWLKTGAHRLRKWVPTSAEYRREIMRATAEARRVADTAPIPVPQLDSGDVLDGEVVDDAWSDVDVAKPGGES